METPDPRIGSPRPQVLLGTGRARRTFVGLTADEDEGVAIFDRFSRKSLEHLIGAATGERAATGEMLYAIPRWAECVAVGLRSFDEHVRELEEANPGLVP
jgi:hypothetical protein